MVSTTRRGLTRGIRYRRPYRRSASAMSSGSRLTAAVPSRVEPASAVDLADAPPGAGGSVGRERSALRTLTVPSLVITLAMPRLGVVGEPDRDHVRRTVPAQRGQRREVSFGEECAGHRR